MPEAAEVVGRKPPLRAEIGGGETAAVHDGPDSNGAARSRSQASRQASHSIGSTGTVAAGPSAAVVAKSAPERQSSPATANSTSRRRSADSRPSQPAVRSRRWSVPRSWQMSIVRGSGAIESAARSIETRLVASRTSATRIATAPRDRVRRSSPRHSSSTKAAMSWASSASCSPARVVPTAPPRLRNCRRSFPNSLGIVPE